MSRTVKPNLFTGERLPNTRFNEYPHLNSDKEISGEMNMNELAKVILSRNYGVQRFLSALHDEAINDTRIDRTELVDGLEELFFNWEL